MRGYMYIYIYIHIFDLHGILVIYNDSKRCFNSLKPFGTAKLNTEIFFMSTSCVFVGMIVTVNSD